MKFEEKKLEFTAYIETENEKGFLQLEYGQGESLLFLVKNIEEADFFRSKEVIYNELKDNGCNYSKIEFFKKEITINTKITKEVNS